jgi:hypothetical protein
VDHLAGQRIPNLQEQSLINKSHTKDEPKHYLHLHNRFASHGLNVIPGVELFQQSNRSLVDGGDTIAVFVL